MPSCASSSWIASSTAGRPSRSPAGWPATRRRPASVTRASTASSMTRSGAPTTALGATICPEPRASAAGGLVPAVPPSASSKAVFPSLCGLPRSACEPPSVIGRPTSCFSPAPGPRHLGVARTQVPSGAVCQAALQGGPSWLLHACSAVHRTRSATAQNPITFDTGNRVRPSISSWSISSIVQTFFCDPHSPWQKATIKTPSAVCDASAPQYQHPHHRRRRPQRLHRRLQNTPRKCLGFQTPSEVFLLNFALQVNPPPRCARDDSLTLSKSSSRARRCLPCARCTISSRAGSASPPWPRW